jgi:hypothetical protein
MQPRKIHKHPSREIALFGRLMLDVNQKARVASAKTRLDNHVGFVAFARRHVGEDFLVEKFN